MKIVKSVLEEKLKSSLRMQSEYEKTLAALPRGVLVRKFVKGHQYCYLMTREGSKVRFEYKGKLFGKEIARFDEIKKERTKYRRLLIDVKRQIAFLRRTLRDRELRAVS